MIVDTGVLYALADADDTDHLASTELFSRSEEKIVPEPVIVEADYLILRRLGVDAELAFLRSLTGPWLSIEVPTHEDRVRAAELATAYRELRLGYVDSVVVAIAERLGESVVATVDRRHFSVVRPRHVESFIIIP